MSRKNKGARKPIMSMDGAFFFYTERFERMKPPTKFQKNVIRALKGNLFRKSLEGKGGAA